MPFKWVLALNHKLFKLLTIDYCLPDGNVNVEQKSHSCLEDFSKLLSFSMDNLNSTYYFCLPFIFNEKNCQKMWLSRIMINWEWQQQSTRFQEKWKLFKMKLLSHCSRHYFLMIPSFNNFSNFQTPMRSCYLLLHFSCRMKPIVSNQMSLRQIIISPDSASVKLHTKSFWLFDRIQFIWWVKRNQLKRLPEWLFQSWLGVKRFHRWCETDWRHLIIHRAATAP